MTFHYYYYYFNMDLKGALSNNITLNKEIKYLLMIIIEYRDRINCLQQTSALGGFKK